MLTISEVILSSLPISNARRLFSLVIMLDDTPMFGTSGSTSPKPTYSHLKAELLQSDKNQISISEETMVNVTTVTSVPHEPTPHVSFVAATKSTDSINPTPIPPQSLQCAMCGQPKSSHPSGCPNYGVTCSACGIVVHNLLS